MFRPETTERCLLRLLSTCIQVLRVVFCNVAPRAVELGVGLRHSVEVVGGVGARGGGEVRHEYVLGFFDLVLDVC